MRILVRTATAAAVLVTAVGLLGGCTAEPAVGSPSPPTTSQTTPVPGPTPTTPAVDERIDVTAVDRGPLGLDVRYVDGNGKFVTLPVDAFPR